MDLKKPDLKKIEDTHSPVLLIASYLEPEYVSQIQRVDPGLTVIYKPELLPVPRFACDHAGKSLTRTADEEKAWHEQLSRADILFGFDSTHMQDLPELAPNVRWVQATSAGIGQAVKRFGYDERMPDTVFTTASGVHVRPLAEFVIMALIMHYKQMRRVMEDQTRKHWERFAGTDLEGRVVGIVGLGHNGSEVARMTRLLGMRVLGCDLIEREGIVDTFYPASHWREMLPQLDALVLAVPHTTETEKMVGAAELSLLPQGSFFINICRGIVVDEKALIESLESAHLSGAALDVFEQEPLPEESPLWKMPNVLVSPHSASTSDRENRRITDLFCDNLRRYLSGEPLRNVLDMQRLY
jgi:glyoxylate/hydroxypyruvate reductase A